MELRAGRTLGRTVRQLVDMLQNSWNRRSRGVPVPVMADGDNGADRPRERSFLALDSSKAQAKLGWGRLLDLDGVVDWTTEWYVAAYARRSDRRDRRGQRQISRYLH